MWHSLESLCDSRADRFSQYLHPTARGRRRLGVGSKSRRMKFCAGGWFARDAEILERVGKVLLPKASRKSFKFRRWLVAKDVFALADNGTQTAIFQVTSKRSTVFMELLTVRCQFHSSGYDTVSIGHKDGLPWLAVL